MKNKRAIILLSGGLDSVVSLASVRHEYSDILALTFNYGQKPYKREFLCSEKIAKYYKIKHDVFDIKWLKNFYSINIPSNNIQDLENIEKTKENAKAVWIPNRNALFINLAACIAEAHNYSNIIIGANKEEAKTFKDNSKEFINAINLSLKNSTQNEVQVIAPLINMNKEEIVKKGLELKVPFELIYSCYNSNEKHCGKCESCLRLKRALQLNGRDDIINKIF